MRGSALKIFVLAFMALFSGHVSGQVGNCIAYQNACSNPSFTFTNNGPGNALPGGLNVSNPQTNPAGINSGCLLTNGPAGTWMVITVGSSGMLGFSFGAGAGACQQSGFYDWAMWSYTPNTCTNIFNNTLPPVACNWNASSSGGTGMGAIPAGGNPGNFQPSIPVNAGDQFIILISNFSGINSCVSIVNNGSAGLTCSPLILPSFIRCPGQQAVMTATWAANVTNVSYTLTTAMPLNVATYTVQSNPTFIVAPTSTQVYTVLASGSNTLSAVVTTSNTFTVTISPTTTMNVTSPTTLTAADNASVCYNTPAIITTTTGGTNYTLTSVLGTPPIYSAIGTIQTPSIITTNTYVMATTLFSGCTATGAVVVNVAPNHQFTSIIPNINVCLNGTAVLTSSLETATFYNWSGPNSFVANTMTTSITNMQLSGSGVYTVNANINFGSVTCPRSATTAIDVIATSPVVISASPSKTLCQGSHLNLSNSISGTAAFLWSGPNNFNVAAQTTTVANLVPASGGIYTATAIFSNAVASCPITNTVEIRIIATAVPTISIPSLICQNDTAHLVVITSGTPAPTILWQGNTFLSSNSATTIPNIQPGDAGLYTARAFYTGGYTGATVCPTQASGQINVVSINSISIIPPPPICRPSDLVIYSSAVGAISYSWSGPNGFTDHQANPILSHPGTNASGVYTVNVAFGGSGLICYNHNTVQVTVNPVLNFSLVAHQANCEGAPMQISGPPGATSYSWTSSSGFTSNQQNISIPALTPMDEGVYNLSVSLGPCVTTQSSNIEVFERMQQTYFQESMTICKGEAVTFKTDYTGSTSNPAVNWMPSVYLNAPTGTVQTNVKPQGTTVYTMRAYDVVCSDYAVSHTFTVTVLEAAKPHLQLEKTQGCGPLCMFYDSKVPLNNSIISYDFIGSNGKSRRFQNDAFMYCIEDAGSYTVRVRSTTLFENDKVCSDSTDYPDPIIVNPAPGSDISWYPESPTISDNTVTFMSNSKNSSSIVKQKWIFAGTYNDSLDAIAPRRLFEHTGKYPVIYISTTDLGCTDTVIKYLEIREDFNVYIPNSFTPNGDNLNDVFQMKGTGVRPEAFTMEVYDRWGSLIFSTKDPVRGWDGTVRGQPLGEGIYVYKIKLSGANGEGKKEYLGQVTLIR